VERRQGKGKQGIRRMCPYVEKLWSLESLKGGKKKQNAEGSMTEVTFGLTNGWGLVRVVIAKRYTDKGGRNS